MHPGAPLQALAQKQSFIPIIAQCIFEFHCLHANSHLMASSSLLLQYMLLHSDHSLIKLCKVSHGGQIGSGLKAKASIPAGTYILTASGSMSLDIYGKPGFSVIMPTAGQLGLSIQRLILGPFWFANHECEPNCQVIAGFYSGL